MIRTSVWEDRIEDIKTLLAKGTRLKTIGYKYGVSRQRIYQILEYYDIKTPTRDFKNASKDLNNKEKWLKFILQHRRIDRIERHKIFHYLRTTLPDICPVLGIPIDYEFLGTINRSECSPSLDRIDNSKGYEFGNIVVVSWRANRIKNDGLPEEHLKIYTFYKALDNEKLTI